METSDFFGPSIAALSAAIPGVFLCIGRCIQRVRRAYVVVWSSWRPVPQRLLKFRRTAIKDVKPGVNIVVGQANPWTRFWSDVVVCDERRRIGDVEIDSMEYHGLVQLMEGLGGEDGST